MTPIITIIFVLAAAAGAVFLKTKKQILGSTFVLATLGAISVFSMSLPILLGFAENWHS